MPLWHQDYLHPVCGCSILCETGLPTFLHVRFWREGIIISKQHNCSYKKRCNIHKIYLLFVHIQMLSLHIFVSIKGIEMHCKECILLQIHYTTLYINLQTFLVVSDGICTYYLYQRCTFTEGWVCVALNTSPNAFLMHQCLLIISLPKMELHFTLLY